MNQLHKNIKKKLNDTKLSITTIHRNKLFLSNKYMVNATKELLYTKGLFSALELILSPQASELNPMLCPVVGRGSKYPQDFPHQI
jgi:hypothetical protein